MPPFCRAVALALLLAACSRAENASSDTAPGATSSASAAVGAETSSPTATDPRILRADSARIAGSPSAPVWVVEVSDYQCPFCRDWHREVYPALQSEFIEPGVVRFAYVHFPLSSHQHARLAAEAAMCAGAQGKFWEYHDRLFDSQDRWAVPTDARPVFDSLAANAGLDTTAYSTCLDEGVMREMVRADYERMQQAGVSSTPTFFVGSEVLRGAQPIEAFRAAIARARAAAGADSAETAESAEGAGAR